MHLLAHCFGSLSRLSKQCLLQLAAVFKGKALQVNNLLVNIVEPFAAEETETSS